MSGHMDAGNPGFVGIGGFGGGAGGGGVDLSAFGGAVEVLPFTGISTIPLVVAGLVATIVGAISTWLGTKREKTGHA